jgi:hypothetical protein
VEGFCRPRKRDFPHEHPCGQWASSPSDAPIPATRALASASLQQPMRETVRRAAAAEGIGLSDAIRQGPCRRRPLSRMCRRPGAIPSQRPILSHPLGSCLHLIAPGLCDMAPGEAETCLGKLTTLRSVSRHPAGHSAPPKLDQGDGRKRDQTSRCRRLRDHTCSPGGIAPGTINGARFGKRDQAGPADALQPKWVLVAAGDQRGARLAPTILARQAARPVVT